jgi:hypothetical protein
MKKSIFSLTAVFVFMTVINFTSCDTDLTKIDTKPAESALEVLNVFADIILTVDDGLVPDSASSGKKLMKKNYTETITGDFPTKLLTWDFGTAGDYQGLIYILLTDEYVNPNSVVQVSFENFIYKGKPVDGLLTFENLGKTSLEQDEFTVELNEARVGSNKLSAGWKLQRTAGGETPVQSDDLITIAQIDQEPATGVTDEGIEFTLTLIEGLQLDLVCEHILVKGIFEMIFGDNTTLKADFGDGACDNKVNVSNGVLKVDLYL